MSTARSEKSRSDIGTRVPEDVTRRALVGDVRWAAGRAVLAFSAGCESSVLAHLLWTERDRLELAHVETGAELLGRRAWMEQAWAGYRLKVIDGARDHFIAEHGLPARVVPLRYMRVIQENFGLPVTEPRIIDWTACCHNVRIQPLIDHVKATRPRLFIVGNRGEDGMPKDHAAKILGCQDVKVVQPLWDWSRAAVLAYLERHAVPLPPEYATLKASVDCWDCPAKWDRPLLEHLARTAPAMASELRSRIEIVNRAAAAELAEIENELRAPPAMGESHAVD